MNIRPAERADVDTLYRLTVALADFEKLPPPTPEAWQRFTRDGWPDNRAHESAGSTSPRFRAYLLETEDVGQRIAIGYAVTFDAYSTFLARPTLYLEDLFVLPAYRGQGGGRAMLTFLRDQAKAAGYGRMEWSCLDWNTDAQRVYERFGANRLNDWLGYRVDLT